MADYVSNVTDGSTFDTLMARLNNIFDLVYPVGCVYTSFDATSPASLFGGTWERLSNVFLYATNVDEDIDATGGEATHTLTVNEMPSHTHSSGCINSALFVNSGTYYGLKTGGDTGSTGGGQPHNNLPPYQKCAMWKRIA